MKAVVLAAGEGVRLLPITSNRPKHMIRIGGKPILEHCLDALKACGIREVLIVTHYMSHVIREHFGDGSSRGLTLQYVEQPRILGTGNAVSLVKPHVDEAFALVYGDLLFTSTALEQVLEAYTRQKPSVTMAVVPVDTPESYGIVEVANGLKVQRVVEKPPQEKAPSNLANAGLYVLSTEIFESLKQTSMSVRGEWEITDALTALAASGGTVLAAAIPKDEWMDIGRPWDLLEANRWVLQRMRHEVYGTIENGAHLIGNVTVASTARVRSGAYVEGPVYIDEGSDIGPNCYIRPCTSIGRNVRIGNACEIKNSLIMDWTHVGHLSYVGDSVLCEHCNLGAGTITANYRLDGKTVKMLVKDKLVDTGRRKLGAIIGDNVKTGINALFMPGVKVGQDSWIGPNFTVHRDIPPKTMALPRNNHENLC